MELTVTVRGSRTSWLEAGLTADFGEGVEVRDIRVLENALAEVDIAIDPFAELGFQDVAFAFGDEVVLLEDREGFLVETGGLSLSPDRARLGESLAVTITGYNTLFQDGTTFASFGEGVYVDDVEVIHEELAIATVSVDPTARAGWHDVVVYNGPTAVTLVDGFLIDRSALSASFTPGVGRQGQTLDFTIVGLDTSFGPLTSVDLGPDIDVTRITVIDAYNAYGTMQISNGADIGLRDVTIQTGAELLILHDVFDVLEVPPDIRNVQVSFGLGVSRTLDNSSCGDYSESVSASVVFFEPLDPPCGPPPTMAFPYDINYNFEVQESPDCPSSPTFDAGEQVYFESPEHTIVLTRNYNPYTGQTIYVPAEPLSLSDYVFDTVFDLRADGSDDPNAVPAFTVEGVLPTVPRDFSLTAPELCNNYSLSTEDTLVVEWTMAETYDVAMLTLVFQTADETGAGRYLLTFPWDDGLWEWGPDDLSLLPTGSGYLVLTAGISGPEFLLPFGTGGPNQGGSSVRWLGSATLRAAE